MALQDLNVSPYYAAVSKSDTVDYLESDGTTVRLARALFVGGAGNVVVVDKDNNAVTFTSVQAGQILPCLHRRVNSTSTTATNMVALF